MTSRDVPEHEVPPPAYDEAIAQENPILNLDKRKDEADLFLVDDDDVQLEVATATAQPSSTTLADWDRGTWDGRFDFLMSMTAYAVGLGNVWRFPYLCFKNGGGAFLVAYAVFWLFAAVPIFLLEVTLGQYLQRGGIAVWDMCPLFKGVGLANVIISFVCLCYYCIIAVWAIFYVFNALTLESEFPWESCSHWWNERRFCVDIRQENNSFAVAEIERMYNRTAQTSVEQFWDSRVLQRTDSIEDTGGVRWELLAINAVLWIMLFAVLCRGITKARPVVYVCSLLPYGMLLALLVRGLTLPGAYDGLHVYLVPNMTKLADPYLWQDAGTQVFYSYGVGYGALIALGSHNKYTHNCYRDALVMCTINGSTSLLAGFVVFSILGFMARASGKLVVDVVKSGVGLAFLVYPEVTAILPLKQLWAVLLFSVITILGMDSQLCVFEGTITALEDVFPFLRAHKKKFVASLCMAAFLFGIPFVTNAGTHWLTLVDAYGCSGIALLFIVFFEVVGIAWAFGASRVFTAMQNMFGRRPCRLWLFAWKYTAPLSCLVLFVALLVQHRPLTYADGRAYPIWALIVGYVLGLASMAAIPTYAIVYLVTQPGTLRERLRRGLRPNFDVKRQTEGCYKNVQELTGKA